MGRVDHQDIHVSGAQKAQPLFQVGTDTDRRRHQEPALGVDGGVGIIRFLGYVLDGDESLEPAFFVGEGELFYPMFLENISGLLQGSAHRGGDESLTGHKGAHRGVVVLGPAKSDIPIGEDTDQFLILPVGDGNTGDLVFLHQASGLGEGGVFL